jgi:hypothetical protein
MKLIKKITRYICLTLVLLTCLSTQANATAIKLGLNSKATVNDSIAIGVSSVSDYRFATALGSSTQSLGFGSTSIGYRAFTSAPGATAVGYGSKSTGHYSSAVGFRTNASGKYSAVLGYGSEARGSGNLVLGENVAADADGSMILGRSQENSPILNSVPNSFSINFFSKTPTFFVEGNTSGVSGKVGIGTNTPKATLDVIGDIQSDSVQTKKVTSETLSSENLMANNLTTDRLFSRFIDSRIIKADGAVINEIVTPNIRTETIDSRYEIVSPKIHTKNINSKTINTNSVNSSDIVSEIAISNNTITKSLEVSDTTTTNHYAPILTAHLATEYLSNPSDTERKQIYIDELKFKKSEAEEFAKKYEMLLAEKNDEEQAKFYSSLYKEFKTKIDMFERQIQLLEAEDRIIKARVGIGTSNPNQLLHINGAMRLEPHPYAPINASLGDIYMDQSGALCVFIGSWQILASGTDGTPECNEDRTKMYSGDLNPHNDIGPFYGERPHIPPNNLY